MASENYVLKSNTGEGLVYYHEQSKTSIFNLDDATIYGLKEARFQKELLWEYEGLDFDIVEYENAEEETLKKQFPRQKTQATLFDTTPPPAKPTFKTEKY